MYLEALKQEERFELFELRLRRLNERRKSTTNAFSSYKLRSKLCLVYLEVKQQQNRCGVAFSNKKARKR